MVVTQEEVITYLHGKDYKVGIGIQTNYYFNCPHACTRA